MMVWPSCTSTVVFTWRLAVVGVALAVVVRTSSRVWSMSRATRVPLRTWGVTLRMMPVSLYS
ncbi:MAG: hypothetical protein BWY88_01144 [Synergistetes bacterium ADurb.Bin520]|nr:MAG: hypothetical protein BWY88_01144 [Synergistetes bacterium ADurb.Bin520]